MTTATTRPLDPLLADPPPMRGLMLRRIVVYGLLLLGVALVLIPFLWMISTSLKTQDQLFVRTLNFIPNPIVPENYLEVWNRLLSINPQMTFWRIMGNTLFITVLAMVGEITSAALVAYGFARFRWRGRDALFALMLATIMIPGIVTRVPGFLIWRQLGLLDTYDPLTWPSLFAWGPLYVFLMRQFFMTIPREYEEAAIIDGANVIQIFVYVMLPLVRPILIAIAVLAFQANWNNFQGPLLYLSTPDKFPLALAMRFFDQSLSREAPQWHYMMAMATMMAAPILLLYFFAQKQFIEGITIGGVKG
ncbi:carbohydrate ABC transporter permease [Kamptonema cortianum]|jgi:multiple sugar transport system permease protein|nr:carbohydrate ABC transporter permease [Geitlerinema splendidum]MDK3157379.1 carbohydrate ABC transporter permease [Kamptonema cortianum]